MSRIFAFLFKLALLGVAASVLWVGAYKFINPPLTYLMVRDYVNGTKVKRDWVPLEDMASHLPRSVIAAEDSQFCSHTGFDLKAIEKAIASNEEGGKLRGGSTVSQQTAKNVFLWPGRTMVRKGFEAYFTGLIELIWGKRRIMEVYLNVVEFGRGVYGAEAASRHYFKKSAKNLSRKEAARLAAILPQPIKRDAASPGPYTRRYADRISKRGRVVANEGLDSCLKG